MRPSQRTSAVMLAYGMPAGELEMQPTIDAWIEVKRGQGAAHAGASRATCSGGAWIETKARA